MMEARSPLERRLRERRYEVGCRACADVLAGLGVATEEQRIVPLDEIEHTWDRYLERLRENADAAERWSADERAAVQLWLDKVSAGLGHLTVVWLASVDAEPVGIEVPAAPLLRVALDYFVTGARDLMLTTRNAADGISVEFNHLATGDEYEIVAWGVFAA